MASELFTTLSLILHAKLVSLHQLPLMYLLFAITFIKANKNKDYLSLILILLTYHINNKVMS